jgi:2-polyprenyl-3-methyl-5-hydroxy-6-metoxy-1,4-benzoquinol methylase
MSEWEASEGEHWATDADGYTRMLAGFGDVVTSAASYRSSERVLDVGCGSGDLTLAAARAVTEAGSVQGSTCPPARGRRPHRAR